MSISPLGVIDFLIFLSLSLFIQWDTNGKSASFRTKVIPLCSLLRAAIRFFPNPLTSASLSSLTRHVSVHTMGHQWKVSILSDQGNTSMQLITSCHSLFSKSFNLCIIVISYETCLCSYNGTPMESQHPFGPR